MTTLPPQTIRALRESWERVEREPDRAAALFYERLFALDPATAPFFAETEMEGQRAKFIATLRSVVEALDEMSDVQPLLRELGVQHAGYGVRPEHYDSVGSALIWSIERLMGPDCTPEIRAAWTLAYALVAGAMRAAGDKAPAPAL
ncbi:MAG: globin domain-containing protein [Pseudomonadota bacterium]